MNPAALADALKQEAYRLGFDLAGISPAVVPPGVERFRNWLAAGYAGEMSYLTERADAYAHPRHILDGAASILMLAMNYRTAGPAPSRQGAGRVSRYAWGEDYHDLIYQRLQRLADFHRRLTPGAAVRGVVDTAPLLEREFAALAGLGWIGKNTLLLNQSLGSWFFLAALLTSAELPCDAPPETDHCGSCRACLDACPTGALIAPYQLDARRCISYLTIELRGPVPAELRAGLDDWLFGCDVCQEVCPWNRRAPASLQPAFRPAADANPADLAALFALDDTAFRARYRHTPLWRARRRGLLRNAALALGNARSESAIPALVVGLSDAEPLVRAASAWSLGRVRSASALAALRGRLAVESQADVRDEIEAALVPT